MSILGKVTTALPEQRGLDVTHTIQVPSDWLAAGCGLVIELPRLLACAECGGGGCDLCERRGAGELRERAAPSEVIRVKLSAAVDAQGNTLRLPEQGALGSQPDEPRGCLMLRVLPGELSKGVTREAEAEEEGGAAPTFSPYLLTAIGLVIALIVAAIVFN